MKSIVGTVDLNATTFHYEMAGIGPPVVLIHAGIADSRMWEGQFAPLSRWFRVVRYDMRGFGLTPPAEGAFSHTDDLAALLRHLGIERVLASSAARWAARRRSISRWPIQSRSIGWC